MSIQKIAQSSYTTRFLKNKTVLKGLEKISEHATSFSAGTSLLMSLTVRPLAIRSTPDVEKENKQYAMSNSICSGIIKFAMVEAVALPIENAVKNIDNNPKIFLNQTTINNLTNNSKKLSKSRSYKLMTQILKLSTGVLTAIPKSILTLAMIPVLMDKVFFKKKNPEQITQESQNNIAKSPNKDQSFTGNFSQKVSKKLGKIIDNKKFQNFAIKYQHKDEDIAKHMSAGTDILLTTSFAYQTSKSDKIKENRKKVLIYNNAISTAITIIGGYGIDKIIKTKTGKFIENFKKINAGDPKLHKYIEGINILRPALIFAGIYYGILPIFSTYMSEKIDKYVEKHTGEDSLSTIAKYISTSR